jgi:hypothetical protein
MGPTLVVQYASRKDPCLMKSVAMWRRDSPEQWKELLRAMNISLKGSPDGVHSRLAGLDRNVPLD